MADLWSQLLGAVSIVLLIAAVGWVLWRALRRSDAPGRLVVKWGWTLVVGTAVGFVAWKFLGPSTGSRLGDFGVAAIVAGSTAGGGILIGLIWASSWGEWLARPFTSLFDGGDEEWKPHPLYSAAEGKRKRGKHAEAIQLIQEQLAQFPDDFRGHLLWASIVTEDLGKMSEGIEIIETFLGEHGENARGLALAMNQEANWHLQYAEDTGAARECLRRVLTSLPHTEAARQAEQRIAHLASPEWLKEQHRPHAVKLGEYETQIGLREEPLRPVVQPDDSGDEARTCLLHLEEFPDDAEARERLAAIYVRHYGRMDLAVEQIDHLEKLKLSSPREVARWLHYLADLQIEAGCDLATVSGTLDRIVKRFPKSAVASLAVQRQAHLRLEFRKRQRSQALRLDSDEN